MDSGSLIMLVIVGLVILAILIGSVFAISCTILYGGDKLRPGTTGHFWIPDNGATYGMPDNASAFPPPPPIFTTADTLSCDKILMHCDNILTHSRHAAVEIDHPPSLSSCDTQSTNQSSADDFRTQIYDVPRSDSNEQQFRPRSQSLGVAVAQIRETPRFEWTKPGRNDQSPSHSLCDTQNTNPSSAKDLSKHIYDVPVSDSNEQQSRPRSQSLGVAVAQIRGTPEFGWTTPSSMNNLHPAFEDSTSSCHI